MSPMMSRPAERAICAIGCGLGWVCGMPGLMTSAAIPDQSATARSTMVTPAFSAASRVLALSSQAATSAPARASACAATRPERPRPSTAKRSPFCAARSIIRSPQLQGGEADEAEEDRDDPEADDDGWLLPALLLEVVME